MNEEKDKEEKQLASVAAEENVADDELAEVERLVDLVGQDGAKQEIASRPADSSLSAKAPCKPTPSVSKSPKMTDLQQDKAPQRDIFPIKDCYSIDELVDFSALKAQVGRSKCRLSDLLNQVIFIKDIDKMRDYTSEITNPDGTKQNRPGKKFIAVCADDREVEVSTTSKTVMKQLDMIKAKLTVNSALNAQVACKPCKARGGALILLAPNGKI